MMRLAAERRPSSPAPASAGLGGTSGGVNWAPQGVQTGAKVSGAPKWALQLPAPAGAHSDGRLSSGGRRYRVRLGPLVVVVVGGGGSGAQIDTTMKAIPPRLKPAEATLETAPT